MSPEPIIAADLSRPNPQKVIDQAFLRFNPLVSRLARPARDCWPSYPLASACISSTESVLTNLRFRSAACSDNLPGSGSRLTAAPLRVSLINLTPACSEPRPHPLAQKSTASVIEPFNTTCQIDSSTRDRSEFHPTIPPCLRTLIRTRAGLRTFEAQPKLSEPASRRSRTWVFTTTCLSLLYSIDVYFVWALRLRRYCSAC